jgi:hypothetical protein
VDLILIEDASVLHGPGGLQRGHPARPDPSARPLLLLKSGDSSLALEGNRNQSLTLRTDEKENVIESDLPVVFGSWTHVAASFDSKSASIYLNGKLAGKAPLKLQPFRGVVRIGGSEADKERSWQGMLDEIVLFDRALSEEEIGQVYSSSRVSVLPGRVGEATRIRVRSAIDGVSCLVLRSNTAQWDHKTWRPPGYLDDEKNPIYINDVEWSPDWPRGPVGYYQKSSILRDLPLTVPERECSVQVRVTRGRGRMSLVQTPSRDNDYTLMVAFDDGAEPGAITYDITVELMPLR